MSMTRKRRRVRTRSDKTNGLILAMLGVMLMGAMGGAYWWIKQSRPQLESETNCPKSGPNGIHVILFDRSDPISEQQAQRVRQSIERFKDEAAFGVRFDVYTVQGDTSHVLEPKIRICALGKPSEANALIENPDLIRRKYEEKFSSVLDRAVDELLRGSKENISPIIESLRAAAITSFGPVDPGHIPLRLTMISDMVQHTSLNSQFQSEPNFQQLSKSSAWPAMQPQFKGAEVTILYLLRPSALRKGTPIQSRGHQLFWEQLIASSGGRLTNIQPL